MIHLALTVASFLFLACVAGFVLFFIFLFFMYAIKMVGSIFPEKLAGPERPASMTERKVIEGVLWFGVGLFFLLLLGPYICMILGSLR